MHFQSRKVDLVLLLGLLCMVASWGCSAWLHEAEVYGLQDVEISDEEGKVRIRIGRLSSSEDFGLTIYDSAGKPAVNFSGGVSRSEVRLFSRSGVPDIVVASDAECAMMSMGWQQGNGLNIMCFNSGILEMKYNSDDGVTMLGLRCDPVDGQSRFLVASGDGGRAAGLVEGGVAGISVAPRGSISAKFSADDKASGVSFIDNSGSVTIGHSTEVGSSLLMKYKNVAAVSLQNASVGRGFGCNSSDGKPAVLLGLNAKMELRASSWSKLGKQLDWFKR